jgi:hypothetical protein
MTKTLTNDLGKQLELYGGLDPSVMPYKVAKATATSTRIAWGFKANNGWSLLTSPESNTKLALCDTPTYGLSLAPDSSSGVADVCRYSTPDCRSLCVAYAGQGAMDSVQYARAWRTMFLMANPIAFLSILNFEIKRAATKHGKIALRLNNFSDLRWEKIAPKLFTLYGNTVQFYDYTKWPDKARQDIPANYDITRSYTELSKNLDVSQRNVAVVFGVKKGEPFPATHEGIPVVNGDLNDERWNDPKGVIVALRAKGRARNSTSDFVIQVT